MEMAPILHGERSGFKHMRITDEAVINNKKKSRELKEEDKGLSTWHIQSKKESMILEKEKYISDRGRIPSRKHS